MTLTTYKWSIEEWHELVKSGFLEGKSVEFLEGEIITVSPKGVEHSYSNQSIADFLRELLKGKAYIRDSHPVTLDNSEPEPDVAIVQLPSTVYLKHHPYPQDIYWLIEISNRTLKTDLNQKKRIYARNDIPEYWVIDLVNKKTIVHTQPKGGDYAQIRELTQGTIAPQAFPSLNISLGSLLLF